MPVFSVAARAMARLVSWPVPPTRVTNMPNLQLLIKVVNSLSFSGTLGGEAFAFAVYGSAGLEPVCVLDDILDLRVRDDCRGRNCLVSDCREDEMTRRRRQL